MIIASRSLRRASAPPPAVCADGCDGRACSMLTLSQADRPVLGSDLNRSESGQSFSGLDFQDFSGLYGKPYGRFASRCSSFGHGSLGQSTLVGGLGVADKLRKAGVAGNGPDLVRGAASLGQASGCGLSQSVRRAMRKPRLVAFAPEPMGEGRSRERTADCRRQERQMTAQRCGNNGREIRMHRDSKLGTGLLLLDV